jgi:PleD family two-component response regulator
VLIVDDDQFIRRLIATTLEDVSEFVLHEAADGVEALDVAQRERPSLVFRTSTCRAWTGSRPAAGSAVTTRPTTRRS